MEENKKKGLKIIIAGGRDFVDYEVLKREVLRILREKVKEMGYKFPREIITIISGNAKGADQTGEVFAKQHKLNLEVCPADWNRWGRAAGPIRNKEMAEAACSDRESFEPILIAFWDGKSSGTKHMIDTAKKMDMDVYVVKYKNDVKGKATVVSN